MSCPFRTDEELVFVEDVVALLEGTYDIHTNFKYTFQEEDYKKFIEKKILRKRMHKKA